MRSIKWLPLLGIALCVQGVVVTQATELVVKNGWVRMPPPISDNTAAYLELHNQSGAAIHLTAITTDVADMAMMHESVQEKDMHTMRSLSNVLIPAQEKVLFEPSGNHIMLIGLHRTLRDGDVVYFKLHFSEGSTQSIMLGVKDVRDSLLHHAVEQEAGYEAIDAEVMEANHTGQVTMEGMH